MQEKSLIKKNILKFIEYKGLSKYEFYKITGITRGILDQNNGMNEENTAIFLAVFKEVSAEWLITGKGEMLKSYDYINKTPPPIIVEEKPSSLKSPEISEKVIMAQQETIETQRRYICFLEEQLNKKQALQEEPAEAGQKRKAG
jgi:hypothetical protein